MFQTSSDRGRSDHLAARGGGQRSWDHRRGPGLAQPSVQEAGFIIKYLLANFISKSCKGRVHGVESNDRSGQCQNVWGFPRVRPCLGSCLQTSLTRGPLGDVHPGGGEAAPLSPRLRPSRTLPGGLGATAAGEAGPSGLSQGAEGDGAFQGCIHQAHPPKARPRRVKTEGEACAGRKPRRLQGRSFSHTC